MVKLSLIQGNLKAPKGQMNKFGGYKYRSAEDILESVKPLLSEHGLILTLSDEMVMVGDRVRQGYSRLMMVSLIQTTAFGRKVKGMDGSQVTGRRLVMQESMRSTDCSVLMIQKTATLQIQALVLRKSSCKAFTKELSSHKQPKDKASAVKLILASMNLSLQKIKLKLKALGIL